MVLRYKETGGGSPLFLLHGLFGSGDNWAFIARRLAGRFRCVLPDLRNHGLSSWSGPFDYRDMAADVLELAGALGFDRFNVLGHSMGAKAAMTLALMAPERVAGLAAADMGPRVYDGTDLVRIIDVLSRLDLSALGARSDADKALAADIPNPAVRGFLLKSLREEDGALAWRLNLRGLRDSFDALSAWTETGPAYEGPALFLRGERSDYIRDEDFSRIRRFFPRADIRTVPGAGHWVHADNADFVIRAIEEFFV